MLEIVVAQSEAQIEQVREISRDYIRHQFANNMLSEFDRHSMKV